MAFKDSNLATIFSAAGPKMITPQGAEHERQDSDILTSR